MQRMIAVLRVGRLQPTRRGVAYPGRSTAELTGHVALFPRRSPLERCLDAGTNVPISQYQMLVPTYPYLSTSAWLSTYAYVSTMCQYQPSYPPTLSSCFPPLTWS
eukprot:351233-Rhodomonas_salina.3